MCRRWRDTRRLYTRRQSASCSREASFIFENIPENLQDHSRAADVTVIRHEGKELKLTEREKERKHSDLSRFISFVLLFIPCSFAKHVQNSSRHECSAKPTRFFEHLSEQCCITPVAYPGILFGLGGEGCSTNSVEDREIGDLGAVAPLVRGSIGGSCNLVQEISFHIVTIS